MPGYPRITVITPSYNQGRFLEQTIRSVLDQEYPNLEFLIVDGGSTDNSVEIIRRYADRITWWVSEKDAGQTDAINKGLRRATGDILAWLNSDDAYCQETFTEVAAFFAARPDCGAVVGDLKIINADGHVLDIKKVVPVAWRWNLYSGCAVPQPATFFTRRAYEIAGELDVSLHYQMDYAFFVRMQAKGVKFGVIKKPLAQFRLHGNSKTVSEYRRKFWRDFARIQDPYLRFAPPGRWREQYRQLMKWLCRAEMYAVRLICRGVVRPFRSTRAREKAGV